MKVFAMLLSFLLIQAGQYSFPQDQWSEGIHSEVLSLVTTTNTTNEEMPRAQNLKNFLSEIETGLKAGKKLPAGSFIVIRVKVSECGDYLTHEVLSSNNKHLQHAGEACIRFLKFSPAIKNGLPVEAWIPIPIYQAS